MIRAIRSVAVGALVAALLAAYVAPCVCMPSADSNVDPHGCCDRAEVGLRASVDCCQENPASFKAALTEAVATLVDHVTFAEESETLSADRSRPSTPVLVPSFRSPVLRI